MDCFCSIKSLFFLNEATYDRTTEYTLHQQQQYFQKNFQCGTMSTKGSVSTLLMVYIINFLFISNVGARWL